MTVVSDTTEQKRVESELLLAKDVAEAAEELFFQSVPFEPGAVHDLDTEDRTTY